MQRSLGKALVVAVAVVAGTAAMAESAKQAPKKKPAAGSVQPTLLGQYGDWGAYTAAPDTGKVCFAIAKPKSSSTVPANRPRDSAYLFISTRPADKVRNEVSVIIGYQFQANTEATAEIGSTRFPMYTERDGAWIRSLPEEARMIEAMRKGADLSVKGTSSRNTQSIDQFSLKGFSQALDRVEQECK
jgi:invasion protein IalB